MNLYGHKKTQSIQSFLFSQYLADGIRITLEIILPAIVCAHFGRLDTGIIISVGALCVSISDAPGPVKHKKNGMLYTNIFIFIMALLTGLVNDNLILLGLLILFSSFFFTMFTIYGNRASSVGTAVLLVVVLRMSKVMNPSQAFIESALILGGGLWYMLIALVLYRLTPYRPAQRSLGECIHETAKFLRIKAEMYNTKTNLESEYKKLVEQQISVSEKQDAVRELLFKNREIVKEPTRSARRLVLTFVSLVDLYEQILASWYDYHLLRQTFSATGILDEISFLLTGIANELDSIGRAIQANSSYHKTFNATPSLIELKIKIDALPLHTGSNITLKKILINLRNLDMQINEIANYFKDIPYKQQMRSSNDYSKFVSHQKIDGTLFINNLTLNSSVFRHSLRMMITCGAGYLIGKLLPYGHHSYWILLTIIIILKPGFSLSRQRNFQRFTGTLAGGILGLIILSFIHDRYILFILIVFFMIGTYTFQRLNYIVMVIFITPYILILFNFLGLGVMNVAAERLLDTGIASVLSFIASYFLFPSWESKQLSTYLAEVLKANINYLQKIQDAFFDKKNSLDYKLTRKDVFVSSANLSSAFHRMLSEPKSKQRKGKEIYEFVVLNHILSSNIAGLIMSISKSDSSYSKEILRQVKRCSTLLEKSYLHFEKSYLFQIKEISEPVTIIKETATNNKLFEQLDFIYKLCVNINKISFVILQ